MAEVEAEAKKNFMNHQEFETAVGWKPEIDDLERANCPKRGQIGHIGCGVCEHGQPVFTCSKCFILVAQGIKIEYLK